uniref:AAA-associated domain-containing protein n=1 Tax=Stenotrophomonas maltophilia TaxID=40324 RepID=UPI001954431B
PPHHGRATLQALASELQLEVDELFPIAETLQLLRFAELDSGVVRLTDEGQRFAAGEVDARKSLFAQHLIA